MGKRNNRECPVCTFSKPKGRVITVGDHTLTVRDKTGKFEIAHDIEESSANDIAFSWSFSGQSICEVAPSGLYFQLKNQRFMEYVNSKEISVRNKKPGYIAIKEIDTQPMTSYKYFVPSDHEFMELYRQYAQKLPLPFTYTFL